MASELTPLNEKYSSSPKVEGKSAGRLRGHRICRSPALGPEEWAELRKKLLELMQKEKSAQEKAGLGGPQ